MQKTVLSSSMVLWFIFSFLFLGCSSAQKTTPQLCFGDMYLETNLDRVLIHRLCARMAHLIERT